MPVSMPFPQGVHDRRTCVIRDWFLARHREMGGTHRLSILAGQTGDGERQEASGRASRPST